MSFVAVITPAQDISSETKTLDLKRQEARVQTRLALKHDQAGRYGEAVAAYKRALELAPNDPGLYNNLGNVFANLGRYDESITALQSAIKLNNPDFVVLAHINLGFVYVQTNRRVQALEALEQAIALNPQFVKARTGVCDLHLVLEQNAEALACYRGLLPFVPSDTRTHINFGIALLRSKRYGEAIVALQETTRRFPNCAEAFNVLGSALTEGGNYKEAIEALYRALALDPNYEAAHYNLALAQLAIKNRDAALVQYALLNNLKASLAQPLYEKIYATQLVFVPRK